MADHKDKGSKGHVTGHRSNSGGKTGLDMTQKGKSQGLGTTQKSERMGMGATKPPKTARGKGY